MAPSPYRTADVPRDERAADPPDLRDPEELILLAVIFVVGAIGVAIGLFSRMDHTTEPSLGFLMMLWVARTFWVERCRRGSCDE